MATVASGPQIVEIEPQVGPLRDRNLVVGVKVALTAVKAFTKCDHHAIRRWAIEAGLPECFDDIRLPGAVNASPTVALEAEHPKSAVIYIVSALGGCATSYVVFTPSFPAVELARSASG
jgi:hypothetical protein